MKITKKLLSVILALFMLLSVIPMSAYASSGYLALTDGGTLKGTYFLSKEVTLSKDITVDSGKTLALYLNDNILNLNGHRIIVEGTLNLYDTFETSTNALTTRYFYEGVVEGCYDNYASIDSDSSIEIIGGVITGGDTESQNDIDGGAVCNNGTFNMYAGNIVGNKIYSSYDNSASGGGVHNSGAFVMNGGTIQGNLVYGQTNTDADNLGGGVYNNNDATFTMNDGTIAYNTATGDGANDEETCLGGGGGINNHGILSIMGGNISNNTANVGGGIYDENGFTLGGDAVVTLNTNKNGYTDNVVLFNNALITPDNYTGTCGVKKSGITGVISTVTSSEYLDNFSSDYTSYGIRLNDDNALEITDTFTVSVSTAFNGTVTANKSSAKIGSAVVLSSTPDSGYSLIDYSVTRNDNGESVIVDGGIFTMPASDVTVNATFAIPESYEITYLTPENGSVSGAVSAVCGETVKLSSDAASGYSRKNYTVYKTGDESTTVTVKNGKFTMPAYPVTVTAEFVEYTSDYLTFTSTAPFTVKPNAASGLNTIQYSTDKVNWSYVGSSAVAVSSSQSAPYVLYFRGTGRSNFYIGNSIEYRWTLTPEDGRYISASGNIMTLLDYNDPDETIMADYAFSFMFYNCDYMTSAPELPATTLSTGCYMSMFYECDNLISAPELPATTLDYRCYSNMFQCCDSLTVVPELPATKLAASCYSQMFEDCGRIHLYENGSGFYFEIPEDAEFIDSASVTAEQAESIYSISGMFEETSGDFTDTPVFGKKYYYSSVDETLYYDTDYLTFSSDDQFTVTLPNKSGVSFEFSYDKLIWSSIEYNDNGYNRSVISLDGVIYFRGTEQTSAWGNWEITSSGNMVAASGNIMTLLDYKDPDNAKMNNEAFESMFANCTSLISAPDLPATTLAFACYRYMFCNCTSLISAPELPATSLADFCYLEMFYGCTALTSAPLIHASDFSYNDCCENMFAGCSNLKVTTTKPSTGSYQVWYFDEVDSSEEEDWSDDEYLMEYGEPRIITVTSLDNMLTGTASGFDTPVADTIYYLLTNDGNDNYSYNAVDNVTLSDSLDKVIVGYTGANLVVDPNTPSNYTLKKITTSTDTTAESDITSTKIINCNNGENAFVTVDSLPVYSVNKEIETDSGITASESKIQSYVDKYKADATADTTYKLTVKAQTPESTEKTAIENIADASETRTVTFFDAKFTKTADSTTTEISDTGEIILSFTVPYDMTGKTDLGVYRYHENEAAELTRVYTAVNPQDGTYYVEGTGANTKVTVFASKFSAYALGATELSDEIENVTYSASLTLNKNIDINFKMSNLGTDGNGTGFDESKLSITVDDAGWNNYTISGGTLCGVLKAVEPKDIGTELHIVVTYNSVVIKDFNYSVKSYCEAAFNAQANDGTGKYDKLAELCEALLNYGKYAEDYSKGSVSSTANDGHSKDFTNYSFGEINGKTVNGTAGAATLSLGSTISLIYYVKTDVELTNADTESQNFYVLNDKNEQIDPARVSVEKYTKDDTYKYIVSIDLYASQLSKQYTLKLKGVDTNTFCITYGVYNYCSDAQNETDPAFTDTLKTLCKAIHNYSAAVDAYIASTAK